MNFSAGPVTYSIFGVSDIVDDFSTAMPLAVCTDGIPDITFEFVPARTPLGGIQHVSLDNFDIASNRVRMNDLLFTCDLLFTERPFRIVIAPASDSHVKSLHRTIKKSWRYFHTHGSKASMHYLKRFVYYIYMPVLELASLQKGASLAHSSAIEKGGRIILFPAWGGVGKTSIMSMYLDQGWKFLADDSCIISSDGTAHIHPLPMHIYKYHQIQCEKLVNKMLENFTSFDWLLWRCISKLKKPDSLVRWVGPDQVFGRDKISNKGTIAGVIHLHRVNGLDTFKIEKVMPQTMARLMASTMMDEINNLALISIVTNSVQIDPIVPDVAKLYEQIATVYEKAFTLSPCHLISLPQAATAHDLYEFIRERSLL